MFVPPPAPDAARALAASLGVTLTAATVLTRRGLATRDDAERFFEPRLADLTPPGAMRHRDAAAERIARAVRAKERIVVFGDYDADGITSTALLTDVLRALGADAVPCLASRFEGGYGFSAPALERVLALRPGLIVTCDCGSSDHPRLADARAKGVDVIVIDHHRVPEEALPAFAFLNPHHPECAFPYKGLASCGLALSVAGAVRAALGVPLDLRRWLDLVALGTIADVAPLDGDNRALVRAGLLALRAGHRPGVRALLDRLGAAGAALTGEDVAFRIAPRINAPGRLQAPDLALALLLERDEAAARKLAEQVDELCQQRREVDRAVQAEAEAVLADPALAAMPVIVLGRVGWHPGVVGIVAGRLAARYGKPTVIVGFEGSAGRGSVRGPAGFPLHDALSRCADVLLGFGGHQAAAGVHLELARLDAFRERFAAACETLARSPFSPADAPADARLEGCDDAAAVLRDLARFEPCGQHNPAPTLAVQDAEVLRVRVPKGGHLRLDLATPRGTLSAFGFDLEASAPPVGARVHAFGKLRPDAYRGPFAVELRLSGVLLAS